MSNMHFERMAGEYATARPPYPPALFDALAGLGVIGHRVRVLEVGAGSGLATADLVAAGCQVTAVEPGPRLAQLLRVAVPAATVVVTRLEDAELPGGSFDSAVAAMSLHWVDLQVGLPKLHRALRPGGWLAVWRTAFGDETVPTTPFRACVQRIVSARQAAAVEPAQLADGVRREERPTVEELTVAGWFTHVDTMRWQWSVELTTDQIHRLFSTFSNWTPAEASAAAAAADECGGTVTEHYASVLHVLRAAPPARR